MKRVQKGTPGYMNYKKKVEIIRTVIYFGIVAAIFLLGYSQTHTRMNVLTVVAVLGCLTSSKALVGVLSSLPYPSIEEEKAEKIAELTPHLTVGYDMLITSREKIMPVDCAVVFKETVIGYTHSKKVNLEETARYIKSILTENHFSDTTVKIVNNYQTFLTRIEGLDSQMAEEKEETPGKEEEILRLILNVSL